MPYPFEMVCEIFRQIFEIHLQSMEFNYPEFVRIVGISEGRSLEVFRNFLPEEALDGLRVTSDIGLVSAFCRSERVNIPARPTINISLEMSIDGFTTLLDNMVLSRDELSLSRNMTQNASNVISLEEEFFSRINYADSL